MRYMGGKVRIAKHITQAILDHTTERLAYWEPFVGGGAVLAKIAPYFQHTYASDTHPDLILMYQAVQQGWLPPETVSEEEYQALRHEEPSALRGAVGFGCSFGGKWFGGYAQSGVGKNPANNYPRAIRNALKRDVPETTYFFQRSYADAEPSPGLVIYCDPPYQGTTGYSTSKGFDHEHFWKTAQRWAESGCHVFVSEYQAPDGWTSVFEKDRNRGLAVDDNKTRAIERLFTWG